MIHMLKVKSKPVKPPKARKKYELLGSLDDFIAIKDAEDDD